MAATFDLFPWFKTFAVSPSTDWEHFINPQFNVTINQSDAAIENHVLSRAGSYGKQLGRMQEVMDILVKQIARGELSAVEQRSLEKYTETREQVVSAVKEGKLSDSSTSVEGWLDELARLKDENETRFADYARRLDDFLKQNPPAQQPAAVESRAS